MLGKSPLTLFGPHARFVGPALALAIGFMGRPASAQDAGAASPPPIIDTSALPPLPPLPPTSPEPGPASLPALAPAPPPAPSQPIISRPILSNPVIPAGCATCGGMGQLQGPSGPPIACGSCGGSGCVPGQKPCVPVHHHTFVGRFLDNLYECLCCPDPCYEPAWIPAANASFFVDTARPRTIQRIRYDGITGIQFPDRNEYFWAREMLPGGPGQGPGAPSRFKNSGNYRGEFSTNISQLSYYQEAATDRASVFVELPYRATNPVITDRHSGFADMNAGTKAMFFDCELMQLTFQFKTYIPTGVASKGLGTGHVSLEPSILTSIRLSPTTYFQGQLAEWIPLGGDPNYQGSILNYRMSFNQVLYSFTPETPLIGTFEMYGYSFQTGSYTDPALKTPQQYSGGSSYFSMGPGLRLSVCNKLDFGAAVAFPVTDPNFGSSSVRVEMRVLY